MAELVQLPRDLLPFSWRARASVKHHRLRQHTFSDSDMPRLQLCLYSNLDVLLCILDPASLVPPPAQAHMIPKKSY